MQSVPKRVFLTQDRVENGFSYIRIECNIKLCKDSMLLISQNYSVKNACAILTVKNNFSCNYHGINDVLVIFFYSKEQMKMKRILIRLDVGIFLYSEKTNLRNCAIYPKSTLKRNVKDEVSKTIL
ncbi:Hypothetical predicted protein [Octopus vulgaris]|uniref:Uncharacterized protein n=1 Tax=Octopus vulgaris TaxID=6645 RepID=A0AA36AXZ0_OCTVU|nr:Hypothetical predicted protein [Octopus vulgaris]